MQATHKSFKIMSSGLVLDPTYPFMGASPDGLVSCSCCGNGVLEIKCPYTCKNKEIHEVASEHSNFCLHENEDGNLKLKENHQYFYQVQMQIKFCNVDYCDFVVFKKDSALFVQRIELESNFINSAIFEAEAFIRLGILPKLIGRWYTKSRIVKKVGGGSDEVMSSSSIAPVSSFTSLTQDEQQLQTGSQLQSNMDDLQPDMTNQLGDNEAKMMKMWRSKETHRIILMNKKTKTSLNQMMKMKNGVIATEMSHMII